MKKYYNFNFADSDAIIIIGAGTIKYDARTDFGPYYGLIVKYAESHGIPVIVSSAGIESKYNEKDIRCRRFHKVLSNSSIRMITTRDDIDELKKYVGNPECRIEKVADFGVFASDVYGIQKQKDSSCVGIGIIASSRFTQFKKGISKEEYYSTIISIIDALEANKQKWKLFTNGDIEDTVNAFDICKQIGRDPSDVLEIPTSPNELVKTISQFKGIITSRLHSCICAYSLDIPFIAISWNNKLTYFAENIGCPERIITKDNLRSEYILSQFVQSLRLGFDQQLKQRYKESAIMRAKEYLHIINA